MPRVSIDGQAKMLIDLAKRVGHIGIDGLKNAPNRAVSTVVRHFNGGVEYLVTLESVNC
jgi:hypothetical protein